MAIVKINNFLHRVKSPIDIVDENSYKRITIRINHQGISLRDTQKGSLIGTKKQFIVRSGQFLLSKIDAMNGAFGIIPESLDNAIITGNFWTYNFDNAMIDIDWFNFFTSSNEFIEICRRASSGTTHRKYLDENKFNNYELNIPSLSKQKEVVSYITKCTNHVNRIKTGIIDQVENTKLVRQTILQDAIQGKLVPQDPNDEPASELLKQIKSENNFPNISLDEVPFKLPRGWQWSRLGNVVTATQGIQLPKSVQISTHKAGYKRYLYISDLKTGHDLKYVEDIYPSKNVTSSDLIMINTGATAGQVLNGIEGVLSNNLFKISIPSVINRDYLYWFLKSPFFYGKLTSHLKGGANPHMGHQIFLNWIFALPPYKEQLRITDKVNYLMKACDQMEQMLIESKQNAEKLMQKILSETFNCPESSGTNEN